MSVQEYQLTKINISDLKFDDSNPNQLTKEQEAALKKAMKRFGYLVPIVINENYEIGDGEHRAKLYKEMGLTEIPAYIVPKINDDIERRLLRQTMNKLRGEHEIKMDADEIALIFQNNKLNDLSELLAQQRNELEDILTKHKGIQFQREDNFDVDKELEDLVPVTELGDIWQLGNHRIVCADCSDKRSTDKLLGDKKPDITLTDPPYSSGGFQEGRKNITSIGNRQHKKIINDSMSTRGYIGLIKEALRDIKTDELYIFTDWRMWSWLYETVETIGFPVRNMIVWDKMHFGMGAPWRTQHELILFAKRSSSELESGKKGNVIRVNRVHNNEHVTQKPIELLTEILDNSIDGDVYDPFLGSGSTLIACEQTNRICYGVEIDPRYIDIIIKRYQGLTGKDAVRLKDNKTYNELKLSE